MNCTMPAAGSCKQILPIRHAASHFSFCLHGQISQRRCTLPPYGRRPSACNATVMPSVAAHFKLQTLCRRRIPSAASTGSTVSSTNGVHAAQGAFSAASKATRSASGQAEAVEVEFDLVAFAKQKASAMDDHVASLSKKLRGGELTSSCGYRLTDIHSYLDRDSYLNCDGAIASWVLSYSFCSASGTSLEEVKEIVRKIKSRVSDMPACINCIGMGYDAMKNAAPSRLTSQNRNLTSSSFNQHTGYPHGYSGGSNISQWRPMANACQGQAPLAFAVAHGDVEFAQLLLNEGGDPNLRDSEGVPLLAVAVLSHEWNPEAYKVVQLLLGHGADPRVVPQQLYKMAAATLTAATDRYERTNGGNGGALESLAGYDAWCTGVDKVNARLRQSLDWAMKYYLERALRMQPLGPEDVRVMRHASLPALPQLRMMLIGQEAACKLVYNALLCHVHLETPSPLVMLFAGPSGHGKTFMAQELGRLTSSPLLFINCANHRHLTDMFGAPPSYVNADKGCELGNFLAANDGKRCVVVLDEFEKTSPEVQNGFLRIFEHGTAQEYRSGSKRSIDCTKAFFILTTNALDQTVQRYVAEHPSLHSAMGMGSAQLVDFLGGIMTAMHAEMRAVLTAAIAARTTCIIPFIPFTNHEASVVTVVEAYILAARFRQPFDKMKASMGDLSMTFQDEEVVWTKLGKLYNCKEEGAKRIAKRLTQSLGWELSGRWREGRIKPGSEVVLRRDRAEQTAFVLASNGIDVDAEDGNA